MNKGPRRTLSERFWSFVEKGEGCWEWTGASAHPKEGYGQFWDSDDRRHIAAHRVSYRLAHGPIPAGLFVLHHCDNPRCVRPSHLYAGTHRQNMADRTRRNRKVVGEAHKRSKLTAEAVRVIRAEWPRSSARQLGDRFGVTESNVLHVVHGRTWSHIKDAA